MTLLSQWLSGKEYPSHLKRLIEQLSDEHISGIALSQLDSPMMKQFRQAKEEVPDALLFFRMGDFYELFGLDAVIASDICGLTLTSRDKTSDSPVPMAGVPVVSYKSALKKCVLAGFKVAVCDQIEDPKQAKTIVKREITRIATPAVPGDLEEEGVEHLGCYLACVLKGKEFFTFAFVDVATGDFRITDRLNSEQLKQEIITVSPREILTASALQGSLNELLAHSLRTLPRLSSLEPWIFRSEELCTQSFREFFSQDDLYRFGLNNVENGLQTVAGLLTYLKATQKTVLKNIQFISVYFVNDFLTLDDATKRHLDFFATASGEKKGSLYHFLNHCLTPSGSRLLLRRLNYPFKNVSEVQESLNLVAEIRENSSPRLLELLKNASCDFDRLTARAAQKNLEPRGMGALRAGVSGFLQLLSFIRNEETYPLLKKQLESFSWALALQDLSEYLERALVDEPPLGLGKGGAIFREGFCPELDELMALETNFNAKLEELEAFEKARSQIPTLKIGYTRVFGYYFEISKGKLSQVPSHFIRKQTLTNGERFITAELKELEEKALSASEKKLDLEREQLELVRLKILNFSLELFHASQVIANIDVWTNFAILSVQQGWCQPEVVESQVCALKESVHPILQFHKSAPFIPNTIVLGDTQGLDASWGIYPPAQIHLITGPNMAGKSTIMRQMALTQILCQIGCFVPAKRAVIGLCDRIFTRIGSADFALKNQSTFMVEMLETAHMLRFASTKSLLLLDEIGRGTSTFDGLSLAWAILEHIHDEVRCRALFSTHYHELQAVTETKPGILPMHMEVIEQMTSAEGEASRQEILFSRKYSLGAAKSSYGVHVARLAGLPESIVGRAQNILEQLEKTSVSVDKEALKSSLLESGGRPRSGKKRSKYEEQGGFTLF